MTRTSLQMDVSLAVSTHLKNICPNGNLPQIGVNIKHTVFETTTLPHGCRESTGSVSPFNGSSTYKPTEIETAGLMIRAY